MTGGEGAFISPPPWGLEDAALEAAHRTLLHPTSSVRVPRQCFSSVPLSDAPSSSSSVDARETDEDVMPREEVQAALRTHVAGIGPPHTLILTGEEGSGKSTELAVLVADLTGTKRRGDRAHRQHRAGPSGSLDVETEERVATSDADDGSAGDASVPFVIFHTFANPSFSQDVSHFLERACVQLKRRFNIPDAVPSRHEHLPGAFAAFLEHAAMFGRVVVVVDAVDAARVTPCASFPAVAMAAPVAADDASTLAGRRTAAFLAQVAWLPRSPPLAVRFVLAGRGTVAVAAAAGLGNGAEAFPLPALTSAQTSTLMRRYVSVPLPGSAAAVADLGEERLARGRERAVALGMARLLASHASGGGVTPLYARMMAPVAAIECSSQHDVVWRAVELAGVDAPSAVAEAVARLPTTPRQLAIASLRWLEMRHGEDLVRVVAVSIALARFGITVPELRAAVMVRARNDHGLDRKDVGGRGPSTRAAGEEARLLLEARRARLRSAIESGGFDEVVRELWPWLSAAASSEAWRLETTVAFDGDPVVEPAGQTSGEGGSAGGISDARGGGGLLAGFDGSAEKKAMRRRLLHESVDSPTPFRRAGASSSDHHPRHLGGGSQRTTGNLEEEGASPEAAGADDDEGDVPLTFRDGAVRAAILDWYAPVAGVSGDGVSLRQGYHRDLAAFFLRGVEGFRGTSSRRALRAGMWHAAAAGDDEAVAVVLGRRGTLACLSTPGMRSEVAAAATVAGRVSRSLWSAWERELSRWTRTDAGGTLACASLLTWLGEPQFAAAVTSKTTREAEGSRHAQWPTAILCVLALAQGRAEVDAGDVSDAENTARKALDLARVTRLDRSIIERAARESTADFAAIMAAEEVDYTILIPPPWRDALTAIGGITSALRSPDLLNAEALSLMTEIRALRLAPVIEHCAVSDDAAAAVEELLGWHDEVVVAWQKAVKATAPHAIATAVAAALAGDPPPKHANGVTIAAFASCEGGSYAPSFGREEEDNLWVVVRFLTALRDSCVARSRVGRHADASVVTARRIGVLIAVFGSDHPSCGLALIQASEAEETAWTEAAAWAEVAYDTAVAFYGVASMQAARASWCLAEALRHTAGDAAARPMYAQSLGATRAILGGNHPTVGAVLLALSEISRGDGRFEEASTFAGEALKIAALELPMAEEEEKAAANAAGELAKAVSVATNVANAAARAYKPRFATPKQSADRRIETPNHEAVFAALHASAEAADRRSRLDIDVAVCSKALARIAECMDRLGEAEALYRRAVVSAERALGFSHPGLSPLLSALGRCLLAAGRLDAAEACFRHAFGVDEASAAAAFTGDVRSAAAVGVMHPRAATHLAAVAGCHKRRGRASEAEVLYLAALGALETPHGVGNGGAVRMEREFLNGRRVPMIAELKFVDRSQALGTADAGTILNNLAMLYKDQGRLTEASRMYERSIALGSARMRAAATSAGQRAAALLESAGTVSDEVADQLASRPGGVLDAHLRDAGWRNAASAVSMRICNLGALRALQGRPGEASACALRALTLARQCGGPDHPETAHCRGLLTAFGGPKAATCKVGHAAGIMIDGLMAGDFKQLEAPFRTAWGPFAVAAKTYADAPAETTGGDWVGRAHLTPFPGCMPTNLNAHSTAMTTGSGDWFASTGSNEQAMSGLLPRVSAGFAPQASNATTDVELWDALPSADAAKGSSEQMYPPGLDLKDTRRVWSSWWGNVGHPLQGLVDELEVDATLASVVDDVAEEFPYIVNVSEYRRAEVEARKFDKDKAERVAAVRRQRAGDSIGEGWELYARGVEEAARAAAAAAQARAAKVARQHGVVDIRVDVAAASEIGSWAEEGDGGIGKTLDQIFASLVAEEGGSVEPGVTAVDDVTYDHVETYTTYPLNHMLARSEAATVVARAEIAEIAKSPAAHLVPDNFTKELGKVADEDEADALFFEFQGRRQQQRVREIQEDREPEPIGNDIDRPVLEEEKAKLTESMYWNSEDMEAAAREHALLRAAMHEARLERAQMERELRMIQTEVIRRSPAGTPVKDLLGADAAAYERYLARGTSSGGDSANDTDAISTAQRELFAARPASIGTVAPVSATAMDYLSKDAGFASDSSSLDDALGEEEATLQQPQRVPVQGPAAGKPAGVATAEMPHWSEYQAMTPQLDTKRKTTASPGASLDLTSAQDRQVLRTDADLTEATRASYGAGLMPLSSRVDDSKSSVLQARAESSGAHLSSPLSPSREATSEAAARSSAAARHALDLEDEVRRLRLRLAAAEKQLRESRDDVDAANERAELRFAAAEAAAATHQARLQLDERRLDADASQLRREAMTWTIRYLVHGVANHAVEIATARQLQARADEAVIELERARAEVARLTEPFRMNPLLLDPDYEPPSVNPRLVGRLLGVPDQDDDEAATAAVPSEVQYVYESGEKLQMLEQERGRLAEAEAAAAAAAKEADTAVTAAADAAAVAVAVPHDGGIGKVSDADDDLVVDEELVDDFDERFGFTAGKDGSLLYKTELLDRETAMLNFAAKVTEEKRAALASENVDAKLAALKENRNRKAAEARAARRRAYLLGDDAPPYVREAIAAKSDAWIELVGKTPDEILKDTPPTSAPALDMITAEEIDEKLRRAKMALGALEGEKAAVDADKYGRDNASLRATREAIASAPPLPHHIPDSVNPFDGKLVPGIDGKHTATAAARAAAAAEYEAAAAAGRIEGGAFGEAGRAAAAAVGAAARRAATAEMEAAKAQIALADAAAAAERHNRACLLADRRGEPMPDAPPELKAVAADASEEAVARAAEAASDSSSFDDGPSRLDPRAGVLANVPVAWPAFTPETSEYSPQRHPPRRGRSGRTVTDPNAITRTYGVDRDEAKREIWRSEAFLGNGLFLRKKDDAGSYEEEESEDDRWAVDRHVPVAGATRRPASEQLMDLVLDVHRPPDPPMNDSRFIRARVPESQRINHRGFHQPPRDSFWDKDGLWKNPYADWAPPVDQEALALPPRRAAGAAPPRPSPYGGYEYDVDQAQRLIGGVSKAMKGEWVDPDPAIAIDEAWSRMVEEEGGGGGAEYVRRAEAKFEGSKLLMADLEDAKRRPMIRHRSPMRMNQNVVNVANRVAVKRGTDDDDWAKEMKRRIEKRAAARTLAARQPWRG